VFSGLSLLSLLLAFAAAYSAADELLLLQRGVLAQAEVVDRASGEVVFVTADGQSVTTHLDDVDPAWQPWVRYDPQAPSRNRGDSDTSGQDPFLYAVAALGACGYFAYRAWAAATGRKVGIEKDDYDPYTYSSWPF
jgi:hypothetical protein